MLLLLTACGGGSGSAYLATSDSEPEPGTGPANCDQPPPTLKQLQQMLQAEFDRLGIDPEKTVAQAPRMEENAVFDLAAELVDPDGPGGEPPSGITLRWTERLIADYNQDGMVTGNDLTPIGQNYCLEMSTPQITYAAADRQGDVQYRPSGNPDDGGSGALNWRLARIDGNHDGYILQYDITPIAVHWEERLTGYRIWRKPPGGSFEMVPNPDDTLSSVTIPRPESTSATAPVRYGFTDTAATATGLGSGTYAYYVQPWDGTSATGGPLSKVVVIDNTSTSTPEQPVAALTVTPDFGGAPVAVSLDATGSSDGDGSIDSWSWDFDGDGIIDWVSTDTVPAESSTGTVDTITPDGEGLVTVTYHQGSAEWYFPAVTVVDNDGLSSLPAYAQLGISGWRETLLMENTTSYLIDCFPSLIEVDPEIGRYLIIAPRLDKPTAGSNDYGPYAVWQQADGSWERELIPVPFMIGEEWESIRPIDVVWDESNQPIVLMIHVPNWGVEKAWSAQRDAGGSWEFRECLESEMPGKLKYTHIGADFQCRSGRFSCLLYEALTDKGNLNNSLPYHVRTHILSYDHGIWSTVYTGIDNAETYTRINKVIGHDRANLRLAFLGTDDYKGGPWWCTWDDTAGFLEPSRMDDSQVSFISHNSYCRSLQFTTDGAVASIWDDTVTVENKRYWLIINQGSATQTYYLSDTCQQPQLSYATIDDVYQCPRGVGFFIRYGNPALEYPRSSLLHWRLEDGEWLVETASLPWMEEIGCAGVLDRTQNADGEPVLITDRLNLPEMSDINQTFQLLEHLDPRP